ncbi:MAG: hypothetical protein AB8C95_10210, partial [Phycisphaeraceae bacterium]
MDRLIYLISLSAALAAIAPFFDKKITSSRNLRAFANSEITFSVLLLFVAIPSYFVADSNRSFLPGSTIFCFFFVVTGLPRFVL